MIIRKGFKPLVAGGDRTLKRALAQRVSKLAYEDLINLMDLREE